MDRPNAGRPMKLKTIPRRAGQSKRFRGPCPEPGRDGPAGTSRRAARIRTPGGSDAYSFQPCRSRTLSMAERMSVQVFGFAITALGNMHPSQQTERIFFVTFPLSSRSQ